MRQCSLVLAIARKIKPVGVDLIGIGWLFTRQIKHQIVGFTTLPGAHQVTGKAISYPHVIRRERQSTALNFSRLRPIALILQRFSLLRETIIGQAALDIVNATTLARRKTVDKGSGFFRRLGAVDVRQPAHRAAVATVETQRLLIETFCRGAIFTRHRHIAQPQHCITVRCIKLTCLLVETFSLSQIVGLERRVAFANQRPVELPGLRRIVCGLRHFFLFYRFSAQNRVRHLFLLFGQHRPGAVRRFTAAENHQIALQGLYTGRADGLVFDRLKPQVTRRSAPA